MEKQLALDLNFAEWKEWCSQAGAQPFAARQIFEWIFQKGVLDPLQFSNVPLKLREMLQDAFCWELPRVDSHLVSKDESEKYLLETYDGELIEMVLMPSANRVTLCVSSQVGCKMGCTFCQTGKMGLKRDLSAGEILSQIFIANRTGKRVTNVVFMGMGEPLDNYAAVIKACKAMIDPQALGLSRSKVTVSTSGLVPEIERLGQDVPVRLAISLHSCDDEKRSKMMPVNRKYNLAALKEVLLRYPAPPRHGITFEYVMIEGVNDHPEDAKKLVRYLHGLKAKVNLIPINHFPGIEMQASSKERLQRFQSYLSERSIPAPIRYSRGQDISGGCGQLAAKRQDELDMDPRQLHRMRRAEARSNASEQ